MKKLLLTLAFICLTGCSMLIPKRVEFFQDKVKPVPGQTAKEREIQRQTAARAYEKAQQTYVEVLKEECPDVVSAPAEETVALTKAVSTSVGPPLAPSLLPSKELATRLDTAGAKLTKRVDEFKEENNENAGKKIEGTGLFSVPYLVVLGGAVVLVFILFVVISVGWTAVKLYGVANPPIALGVKAVQTSASFAKQAFSEVLKGGEEFKNAVKAKFDEDAQKQILELFRTHQERAQSQTTQDVVKELTKK